jgi:hypothetical protein
MIGAYRVVEKIGSGGMGEVYRGERADGTFAHQVAIKVTQSTIGHGDLLRRFKIERQILATLQHPHIVTLLDGGATSDGRAYLVMEHVDGIPITQYCEQAGLSLHERLRIFIAVCDAAQYAHQHAIVHRDLKPANILVTKTGAVKVLDFGVAKLLGGELGNADQTVGVLPGPLTPNYASPEQLRGLPVTIASDIYALGVLLFEIVSGQRPYDTAGLTLDRVLEVVLHSEPPRLRGDIDAIVRKAMNKEPRQRYDSAAALASDLTRFIHGDPVLARAPSAAYLLRRFVARNKALSVAAMLVLAAAVTAAAVYVRQSRIEQRRFEDARRLVHAVVFDIQPRLEGIPATLPLRKTLIEQTLTYLEAVSRDVGNNVVLLRELANSYAQLAVIQGDAMRANLGDRQAAAGYPNERRR